MLLYVIEKRREASHRLNFLPILPAVQDTLCQLSHLRRQKKMRMKAGGHLDLGGGGQDGADLFLQMITDLEEVPVTH